MPWSLEYAVMHRQSDVTNMLLGLDAALKGDLQIVRALLAHGARVNAVTAPK